MCDIFCLDPIIIYLVLLTFNDNLFASSQELTLFSSISNFSSISWEEVPVTIKLESSENKLEVELLRHFGTSVI